MAQAVLTHPEPGVYQNGAEWERQFDQATVHVQWDPERSLRGEALDHKSIQIGLSRHVIDRYVQEWIVEIRDDTPLTRKLHALIRAGQAAKAKLLLPKEAVYKEAVYPVSAVLAKRLGIRP